MEAMWHDNYLRKGLTSAEAVIVDLLSSSDILPQYVIVHPSLSSSLSHLVTRRRSPQFDLAKRSTICVRRYVLVGDSVDR